MNRMVSMVTLVAVTLVILAMLVMVFAQFLLPMFLAVVLVIVFRPLHEWMMQKFVGRPRLAAGLTTLAILLIVLLPVAWIVYSAAREAITLAVSIDQDQVMRVVDNLLGKLEPTAERLGVELPDNSEDVAATLKTQIQERLGPAAMGGLVFAGNVLGVLGGMIVALCIMVISLYYFFADGPKMIASFMRLSPLDDRHEQKLLGEFASISRAVVVATLLSAFVQGLLAGGAYWLTGMPLVFLLTALTMLLAMVPFVGAAAVWIPCCLWLYLHDGRPVAAILLAVYGGLVVSMADNLIKPWVLSGQSNLHPLLALLSILGGVQALGPIGILVGPMLVSFLQALLNMFNTELASWDEAA